MPMKSNPENSSPFSGLAGKIRGGKSASTLEIESRKPVIEIARKQRGGFRFRKLMILLSLYEFALDSYPYVVLVNGQEIGSLTPGQSIRFESNPGKQNLLLKTPIGWNQKNIELDMGQVRKYYCQTSMTGIVFWKRVT